MTCTGIIRVGILGCGRIAGLHAEAYGAHPAARIQAVCDIDRQRATAFGRAYAATRVYTDPARFLDDEDVDVVDVVLPHDLHFEYTLKALRAGKHVSLQKPPTFTVGEVLDLAEDARRAGRFLRVFENFSFYPPHRKAAELVAAGAIGEPLSVRLKTVAGRLGSGWEVPADAWTWRMDPRRCGGGPTCFDHGYHCFQLARTFIREPIERVHAWIHVHRFPDGQVYDGPALITWRYAGSPRFGSWEVVASLGLEIRSRYYASDDRTEIHGTEGVLWVNRCTGRMLEEPPVVLYRDGETRAWHDLPDDWSESFRAGCAELVDALLAGRQPWQDPRDAAETLRLAIAAHRSACEGRDVLISEVGPDDRATLPGVASA